MALVYTPDQGFAQQYLNEIYLNSQVNGGKFDGKTRTETLTGERAYVNTFGALYASSAATRYADSPNDASSYNRRLLAQEEFEIGNEIDNWDTFKQNSNYRGAFTTNQMEALMRKKDQVIISNAIGTAYAGKTGTEAVPFDFASQTIEADVGSTGDTGLSVAKLIATKKLFWTNGVNVESPSKKLYFVASGTQIADLLNDDKLTSADYASVKALVQGDVDTFMGFEFIRTELLPYMNTAGTGINFDYSATDLPVDTDATGIRACFAYAKDTICVGQNPTIKNRTSERADKRYNWYSYTQIGVAATRMEEVGVVLVEALEA